MFYYCPKAVPLNGWSCLVLRIRPPLVPLDQICLLLTGCSSPKSQRRSMVFHITFLLRTFSWRCWGWNLGSSTCCTTAQQPFLWAHSYGEFTISVTIFTYHSKSWFLWIVVCCPNCVWISGHLADNPRPKLPVACSGIGLLFLETSMQDSGDTSCSSACWDFGSHFLEVKHCCFLLLWGCS